MSYSPSRVPTRRSKALGRGAEERPFLRNQAVYLVVELWEKERRAYDSWIPYYCLIEVPTREVGRFITLPREGSCQEVMLLDDLIRYNLPAIFPDHELGRSFAIKLTRDAELHLEDEIGGAGHDAGALALNVQDGEGLGEAGNGVIGVPHTVLEGHALDGGRGRSAGGVHGFAGAAALELDDLGQDANGDFLGSLGV